ncbi:MAG TPA: hypothetical protein VHV10_03590 [Ktedonobacteraceae bacterium]|jgi:hypothetical protein|nr:hypothetical protein [Ktedonobacteraceae bacterium]
MNLSGNIVSNRLLQKATIEKMNHLQQEILQTPSETNRPCEALAMAYQMLTDEQKIAFILAGGAPCLFHYQQHHTQQIRTGSNTETGQLPVLC